MAKKIGQVVPPKSVDEKKAVVEKTDVAGPRNEKGLLTTGTLVDFDPRKNKPLGKKDFADTACFLEFRAMLIRRQSARLVDVAAKLDQKVTFLRQYGDDEARKRAMKMASLREQLAKLEKEAAENGVGVTEVAPPAEVTA